jgi:LysM repeat protein
MKASTSSRIRVFASPVLALLLAGTAGCVTYDEGVNEEMNKQEDLLLVQEDVRKLSGRIESVELELQRLESQADGARTSQDAQMQSRLQELDTRMRALEAARQSDKQEIVDKLSAKIAEIVARSSPSSGAARKQNVKRATPSSDTGYEHEVKPGESLSAIAAAYGVTVKVIMDNNGISEPNKLRVGQKLFIPQ